MERLDRLGLGANNEGTVPKQESARSDVLFVSVFSAPLCSILHRTLPSALSRIEDKLRDVSERVGNVGHAGSNEDTKVVSELMGYIRDIVDRQAVSDKSQTG